MPRCTNMCRSACACACVCVCARVVVAMVVGVTWQTPCCHRLCACPVCVNANVQRCARLCANVRKLMPFRACACVHCLCACKRANLCLSLPLCVRGGMVGFRGRSLSTFCFVCVGGGLPVSHHVSTNEEPQNAPTKVKPATPLWLGLVLPAQLLHFRVSLGGY